MNGTKNQQIESVIFHWSESIVITKTIDPNFRAIHDANYRLPYQKAQALLDLAIEEMTQTNCFIRDTSMTLCFGSGLKKQVVLGLSKSRANLDDLIL